MNTKQAKLIDLFNFLSDIGFTPVKERNNNAWYLSPLRPGETEASFKIDMDKNYWYDFGIGKGGTIIEFVSELQQTNNISDVLKYIEQNTNWSERNIKSRIKSVFSFQQQKDSDPKTDIYISELKEPVLLNYLTQRGISEPFSKKLGQAAMFRLDKHYVALSFKNDHNGFELRNKYFRGCTSKALTTIKSHELQEPIFVFEGFFDYLSFCEMAKRCGQEALDSIRKSNFLILNSVSLVKQAITALKPYADIRLFLDNDDAGASASQEIIKAYPKAKDCSELYRPYKDLNDYLLKDDSASFRRFISRCAIVRTETKVSPHKGNLAFTPEGRKREETILNRIVPEIDKPREERKFKRRR